MQEDSGGVSDAHALPEQIPVSPNNPCPFLRALVAGGFVDGGSVPLSKLSGTIEAASGERGLRRIMARSAAFGIALVANGLSPSRLWSSLRSGAVLDHLRNGPLDKHGGGSRILDAEAHVHEDQINRLADFSSDWPNPAGGYERGLNKQQICTFMRANLKRDDNRRWYFPILMRGEWPVLLRVMGKGKRSNRYLSVAEVRTLVVERRFPARIVARLTAKPTMADTIRSWVCTAALALIAVAIVATIAVIGSPDRFGPLLPGKIAQVFPPPLPQREPVKAAYWLDQNWTNKDRYWFHHVTQGTATFPVPYKWFMALEQPYLHLISKPGLLSDSAYLERFGFIPSPKSLDTDEANLRSYGYALHSDAKTEPAPATLAGLQPTAADNSDGLPVGFARLSGAINLVTGAAEPDKIGLTCAACHTGSINYQGISIRFDGGPAMVELRNLEKVTGLSMAYTMLVPGRFLRFADRVLGPGAGQAERKKLEKGLQAALDFAVKTQAESYERTIRSKGHKEETAEGFGRLDALNRIGNQVFYLDMAASGLSGYELNQEVIDAPVSFPPIWTVPWFSWAQYDASISQPLIRNAGEALGVFAPINFSPEPAPGGLFRSMIAIGNLDYIERMLHGKDDPFAKSPPAFGGLTSPKWPEQIFADDDAWKINKDRVNRGRQLYAEICVECHLGPVSDPVFDNDYPDKSLWKRDNGHWDPNGPVLRLVQKPVEDMKTDPGQSNILAKRTVRIPGFMVLDPAKDMNCDGARPTSTTDVPYALALMDVVQQATTKWMDDRNLSDAARKELWGDRKNCPNPSKVPVYRARPLNGVWATAPYLHNGSVPSLYWMLKPAAERPTSFCQGKRDFDPKQVGFHVEPGERPRCKIGETLFSTIDRDGKAISGNSTTGHSFEGPKRDPLDYPRGIIGRGFSDEERLDLIEYLKTL
jgi:RoxA-like, cytochrome c-like